MDFQPYMALADDFVVAADAKKVRQLLKTQDFPKFKVTPDGAEFRIEVNASVGILIINGSRAIGISTHATLSDVDGNTHVKFYTSFRPENFLLFFAFAIFMSVMIVKEESLGNFAGVIALFAVCFF